MFFQPDVESGASVPSTFLGRSATFWTGVEALAVCVYTLVVVVTLWFIYRQVRMAAKGYQFDSVRRLQELVDAFRGERRTLFTTIPLDLALSHEQFARRPPKRRKARKPSPKELPPIALTPEQSDALQSLSSTQRQCAELVIARLNDIGQLVEDGLVDRAMFLGKYHVMVIQCCHMVEAVRRSEEQHRGGNYGQRLLRMRQWAVSYNDICPKHREISIDIVGDSGRRLIYRSPTAGIGRQLVWRWQLWLGWY